MKIALIVLLFLFFLIGSAGASPDLLKVREKHERSLLSIEGVTGVTHDPETNHIIVFLEKSEIKEKIPKQLDGIAVTTKVTGKFRALGSSTVQDPPVYLATAKPSGKPATVKYSRTGIVRPLVGGISVGSSVYPSSAGTLGLVVKGPGNKPYLLSNAHVLAMTPAAKLVDLGTSVSIWQPGGYDGGSSSYVVGILTNYIGINLFPPTISGYSVADAAIAEITDLSAVPSLDQFGYVLNQRNNGLYKIAGITTVGAGNVVRKSGRTTGVTTGVVLYPSALVKVYYTDTVYAIFTDQIITTSMSKAGDSGSAVDYQGKFVGLLFAGSSANSIICKQQYILPLLHITI